MNFVYTTNDNVPAADMSRDCHAIKTIVGCFQTKQHDHGNASKKGEFRYSPPLTLLKLNIRILPKFCVVKENFF